MTDKPDFEKGVYRIQMNMRCKNPKGQSYFMLTISDLIFIDEIPFAVFEWGGSPNKQYLSVKIELDPTMVEAFQSGDITHFYHGNVDDPRTIQ